MFLFILFFLQIVQRDPYGAGGVVGGISSVDLDLIRGKDDPTTYFEDGIRKIDFILVFEEKGNIAPPTEPPPPQPGQK